MSKQASAKKRWQERHPPYQVGDLTITPLPDTALHEPPRRWRVHTTINLNKVAEEAFKEANLPPCFCSPPLAVPPRMTLEVSETGTDLPELQNTVNRTVESMRMDVSAAVAGIKRCVSCKWQEACLRLLNTVLLATLVFNVSDGD
jgi:hypothetical protein